MNRPGPLAKALLALAIASNGVDLARAQAPDYEAAKRHYQAGEAATAKGDHATAAREFKIALDITGDPVLYFKIGSALDHAGDCKQAKTNYQRYLDEASPSAAHRTRTEGLIANCTSEGHVPLDPPAAGTEPPTASESSSGETPSAGTADSDAPASAPPATSPGDNASWDEESAPATSTSATDSSDMTTQMAFDDFEPSWQRTAAWTSVGLTVALLTTGGVLALAASSHEEDLNNLIDFRDSEGAPARYTGTVRDRYEDLASEGERLEDLAVVAFAATSVSAAAAVLFFVLDAKYGAEEPRRPVVQPTASANGFGLSVGGHF